MFSLEDIKTVYNEMPLDELVNDYNSRQRDNIKLDSQQFSIFLSVLNKQLNKKALLPFHKTMLREISNDIIKNSYSESLIHYFAILSNISKPRTTDYNILTSLEWQMQQAMSPSYNELSDEDKIQIIFHIIFGKFDLKVQKQFLYILKKCNYNSSMDLLELMTFITSYYNDTITKEQFDKSIELLTTVKRIKKFNPREVIVDTSYGTFPLYRANDCLGIDNDDLLTLGKCHFAVSKYLRLLKKGYRAYYYIPNYFNGFIEHSVLIDYDKNYVYDLSHNIALPLEYFSKYYDFTSFIISSEDFIALSSFIKRQYGYRLSMHHLEEVKRKLQK